MKRLTIRQERALDVLIEIGGTVRTPAFAVAVRWNAKDTHEVLSSLLRIGCVDRQQLFLPTGRVWEWTITPHGRVKAVEYNPNVWLSEPWDEAS